MKPSYDSQQVKDYWYISIKLCYMYVEVEAEEDYEENGFETIAREEAGSPRGGSRRSGVLGKRRQSTP